MRGASSCLALCLLLAGSAMGEASAQQDPASALRACAAIDAPADRLACYDRLAGRSAPESAARAAAPPPLTAAPAIAPATPPRAEATSAATGSFGLYAAEHPAPPPAADSMTGRVAALGRSRRGRPTITLDSGGVWELDASDPLLAVGDVVTIRRAALQSFILETPTRRQHRASRLQ